MHRTQEFRDPGVKTLMGGGGTPTEGKFHSWMEIFADCGRGNQKIFRNENFRACFLQPKVEITKLNAWKIAQQANFFRF